MIYDIISDIMIGTYPGLFLVFTDFSLSMGAKLSYHTLNMVHKRQVWTIEYKDNGQS